MRGDDVAPLSRTSVVDFFVDQLNMLHRYCVCQEYCVLSAALIVNSTHNSEHNSAPEHDIITVRFGTQQKICVAFQEDTLLCSQENDDG